MRYLPVRCVYVCAIAEQSDDGQPIIFTAFGPSGRGCELQRFEADPSGSYNWSLSPDGSRIAVLKVGDPRILVLYLNGQHPQTVPVEGWDNLATLYWAADGKGWFTSRMNPVGSVLLYVDSNGRVKRLWEQREAAYAYGLPSPDGRHLAIVSTISQSNIWMLDSF